MVDKQLGVAVNIGFPGGINITSPAVSTNLIAQSGDVTAGATNYRVEDEIGNVVGSSWMDPHTKATLEFLIKGTSQTNAQVVSVLTGLTPGTLLTVGTCAALPDLVGTNWEMMDSPKIAGTNRDAKKLTCNLEKRAGITQTTSLN